MAQPLNLLTLRKLLNKLLSFIPALRQEIWILATGRLLLHIGQGFTLVYASIFFVNQIGLSATQVGIALGSASISGVLGRLISGTLADSKFWGRKKTLLLSAAVSALASLCLAFTYNFQTLVIANLLMGLGIGLYWPPTEAVVTDLTTPIQRNEAFSVTRLADSLGLGLGVIGAGQLIAASGNYRTLFVLKSIFYVIFFVVIYLAIAETNNVQEVPQSPTQSWKQALSDRFLMIWLLGNTLFTTYDAQLNSIMPLYFANFVPGGGTETGLAPETISLLFFWHVTFSAIFQLPVARFLNHFKRTNILMVSLLLWCGGFVLVWLTGVVSKLAVIPALCALLLLALAKVIYIPSASSLVGDLAPQSLRGVYFSLESQCWAVGYFIGPSLGGWALDQSPEFSSGFWLVTASSVGLGLGILSYLGKKSHEVLGVRHQA